MSVLAKAIVVIGGDTSGLDAALAKSITNMERAGESLSRTGMKLTTHLTLPLTLAAGAAVHLASDFDSSMRKIGTLTEASTDDVAKWRDEVKRMGPEFGKSADEAADALFFIAGAGIEGDRAIATLEAALKGAAIGLGEVKTVADAATSAMNAYQKTNLTAEQATETLAAAIKFGKIEASTMAPVMGRLTGTAAALEISFADLTGTLAVFSRTGTDASEGATQINAIMSTLLGTSEEGEQVLAAAHLSLDKLREVARGPRGLIEVMRILDDKLTLPQLRKVVPNVRAFRGVMNALAQDSKVVNSILDGTANSAGFLNKAFQQSQGPAFRLQQAWAKLKTALIDIGDALVPVVIPAIQGFVSIVTDAVKWFRDLDGVQKMVVIGVAAFAAALGPLLLMLGSLLQTIAAVKLAMAGLGLTLGGLGLAIGVGSALFVGLTLITAAWVDMRVEVAKTEAAMKESLQRMLDAISHYNRKQAQRVVDTMSEEVTRVQDQIAVIDEKIKLLKELPNQNEVPAGEFTSPRLRIEGLQRERAELLAEHGGEIAKFEAAKKRIAVLDEEAAAERKANEERRRTQTISVEVTNALDAYLKATDAIANAQKALGPDFDANAETMKEQEKVIMALLGANQKLDEEIPELGITLRQLIAQWENMKRTVAAEQLTTALSKIAEVEAALGDSFDDTGQKISAYETAIDALLAAHQPLDVVIPKLGKTLRQLITELEGLQRQASVDVFADALDTITRKEEALGNSFDDVAERAEAYGTAIEALLEAKQPLDVVIPKLGKTLRQLIQEWEGLKVAVTNAETAQDELTAGILKMQEIAMRSGDITQAYMEAVAALGIAVLTGAITQERYNEAMKEAKKLMDDAKGKAEDMGEAIEEALLDVAGRAVDEFVDSFFRASQSIGEFIQSILVDLAKLILKLQILQFLKTEFGLGGGMRHGGFLQEGEMTVVGEAGPELVMAGHGGVQVRPMPPAVANADGEAGGGMGGVNITIPIQVSAIDQRGVIQFFQENEQLVAGTVTKALSRSRVLSGG